jgi:hypothetical protein
MKIQTIACALVAAAAVLMPAAAVTTNEYKAIHGAECRANGTSTTSAEVSVGSFGISNPGATDETVICPMPIDDEELWQQTGTDPTHVVVQWRTGNAPGRIACTAFSGSVAAQEGTVTSSSSTSNTNAANSITSQVAVQLPAADWFGESLPTPVATLVCVLGPKTKIGGIFMVETHQTNQP